VWTPRLEKLWSYLLKIPKLRDALAYANKQISCLPRFGKGKIPYLFLYSSADQMVTGAETKYHIERLKSKGLQIEEYDFKTSAHVQHYKDHKEKYTKLCLDFVAKTRNISKETTRSNWW
jgi:dienelactone hydrolase